MSAATGLGHWKLQRITAVLILLCSIYLGVAFSPLIFQTPGSCSLTFFDMLAFPGSQAVFLIFSLSVFTHAYLGIQMLVGDYLAAAWQKTIILFALLGYYLFSFLYVAITVVNGG